MSDKYLMGDLDGRRALPFLTQPPVKQSLADKILSHSGDGRQLDQAVPLCPWMEWTQLQQLHSCNNTQTVWLGSPDPAHPPECQQ